MKALRYRILPVFAFFFILISITPQKLQARWGLDKQEIISADELKSWLDEKREFVLFDARDRDSFNQGHIEGARLPFEDEFYKLAKLHKAGVIPDAPDEILALEQVAKLYAPETLIVTYCNKDCMASANLLRKLKIVGFKNIRAMEEGFQVWEEKGYPVSRNVYKISLKDL